MPAAEKPVLEDLTATPDTPASTAFGSLLRDDGRTPPPPPVEEEEAQEETKDEVEAPEATQTEETEEVTEDEGEAEVEDLDVDLGSSETESGASPATEVEEDEPRLPKRLLEAAKRNDKLAAEIFRATHGIEGQSEDVAEAEEDREEMRKKFKALIAEGKDFEALEMVSQANERKIRKEIEKRETEAKREQAKQRSRTLKFIEFTQRYPDWRTHEKAIMAEYRRLADGGLGKAAYEAISPEDAYLLAKARAQGGPGPRKAAAAKAVQQAKKEGAAATAAPAGAKPATNPTRKQAIDAEQALLQKQLAYMRRASGPSLLR
jgi:hypothetical protein